MVSGGHPDATRQECLSFIQEAEPLVFLVKNELGASIRWVSDRE